jgi:membrane-bound lytic murein transglycosylase B
VLSEATVEPVKPAELDGHKLALDETVGSLKAKGVDFDSSMPADAPALLIAADEPDGVHWRVGYNNFYAITRYNHSALYAMAVYELAGAVKQQVLATDAQRGTAPPSPGIAPAPDSPLAAGAAPPAKPP